jgi:muramidase (phage lysozyme)
MNKILSITFIVLLSVPAGSLAQSFADLQAAAGPAEAVEAPLAPQATAVDREAQQYLPPDNSEPGYDWGDTAKYEGEHYFYIGNNSTFLKASAAQAADLAEGSGRCALSPNTRYRAAVKPGFEGEHMIVQLMDPMVGCSLYRGYVFLPHVSSSSAGGAWELPRNVRAFLDTLAFAEGTRENYNYIFTFVAFNSYADHPRQKICSGSLCSTAAGRYQFLSKTWDPLAADLGLGDFSPPNQEKATLEIIRRAGAYKKVLGSGVYENFTSALSKLNTTWASLPGSPYGQPTHPTAELWKYYKSRLAKY